jgi:hypothetical protein
MKMNKLYKYFSVAASLIMLVSCVEAPFVEFSSETKTIKVGPDAAVQTISVKSDDPWAVEVMVPWVTVSPANGRGSVECKVMIDSALKFEQRSATITIQNLVDAKKTIVIDVEQDGYEKFIKVSKPEINVESWDVLENRYAEVEVEANVPFKPVFGDGTVKWVECKSMPELKLDREARPRKVTVRLDWAINSTDKQRIADINFIPEDQTVVVPEGNVVRFIQNAPEAIEEGTVAGDSLALISINKVLGCWSQYEVNERMQDWSGVEVWKTGPDKGRVKSAEFFMFGTKESLPFQVRYLTAAEELSFFGNVNTFLLSLDPGEDICKLENLRKLTISAYGLSTLPENFKNLKNLEYLDISSNNFEELPEVITQENFPKLTALQMNACQRTYILDLYTTKKDNFGGFTGTYDLAPNGIKTFPKRLLQWENLDTLRLSFNYLEGQLPDLKNDPDFEKWTAEEVAACDTLPEILVGLPKVLPQTDFFAINHNRLSGMLPDWLLYHPKLDWWAPFSLVFTQEGRDTDNNKAGFTNEPANLDYYYEHYVNKYLSPTKRKN